MEKDLTESKYVIVTEDENVYGPFSSREEAQRRAEILRDPVNGNLPRITITNEHKYVNLAESRVLRGSEDEIASEIVNRIRKTAKDNFGIDI
jgi:hypothetical protein